MPPPDVTPRPLPATEVDLGDVGPRYSGRVHANLPAAALVEFALRRDEGHLTDAGALTAYTGANTGRSPRDRYLVAEPSSEKDVWWGPVNRAMDPAAFDRLL